MKSSNSHPLLYFNRFLPVFLFLMSFQISCGSKSAKVDSPGAQIQSDSSGLIKTDELIATWPDAGSESGDTLNVHGKCVVIMGPAAGSEPEKVALYHSLMDTLKGNFKANVELKFLYSEARYIRAFVRETGKSIVIDRNTFNREPGIMVSDGLQSSKMKNGEFTAEEFSAFIREYFFIPS